MTRNETRAKGARKQRMTNFEKYFGSIEAVARRLANDDSGIGFCKNKPECAKKLDDGEIDEKECAKCALEWLKAEAEREER